MATHLPPDDKELKIDGLLSNQNSLSTKNSVVKNPLKAKHWGGKNEVSELSDPEITLKGNMVRHSSFMKGERNAPKSKHLNKKMGSELSEKESSK